jgi:hypothetical protein
MQLSPELVVRNLAHHRKCYKARAVAKHSSTQKGKMSRARGFEMPCARWQSAARELAVTAKQGPNVLFCRPSRTKCILSFHEAPVFVPVSERRQATACVRCRQAACVPQGAGQTDRQTPVPQGAACGVLSAPRQVHGTITSVTCKTGREASSGAPRGAG